MGIEVFKKHLREKRAIKIATGSENLETVAKVCRAAQSSRASAIDISGSKTVYETARKNTKLPLFVSSIHPFEILEAVKLGVEGVQIGNYFEYYKKGRKFSADEIYDITLETMGLINQYDVFVAVTIPYHLTLDEQIKLIRKLQILGVELFQTEGYSQTTTDDSLIMESADNSIKNMVELSKNIGVDLMTSCSMYLPAVKSALENGANAVCVDSAINKLESEAAMKVAIMEMVSAISHRNSIYREIPKSSREFMLN